MIVGLVCGLVYVVLIWLVFGCLVWVCVVVWVVFVVFVFSFDDLLVLVRLIWVYLS